MSREKQPERVTEVVIHFLLRPIEWNTSEQVAEDLARAISTGKNYPGAKVTRVSIKKLPDFLGEEALKSLIENLAAAPFIELNVSSYRPYSSRSDNPEVRKHNYALMLESKPMDLFVCEATLSLKEPTRKNSWYLTYIVPELANEILIGKLGTYAMSAKKAHGSSNSEQSKWTIGDTDEVITVKKVTLPTNQLKPKFYYRGKEFYLIQYTPQLNGTSTAIISTIPKEDLRKRLITAHNAQNANLRPPHSLRDPYHRA